MPAKNFCYVYHNLSYSKRIKIYIKLIIFMHSFGEWLTYILDIIKLRYIKIGVAEVQISMKYNFFPSVFTIYDFSSSWSFEFQENRLQEIT